MSKTALEKCTNIYSEPTMFFGVTLS